MSLGWIGPVRYSHLCVTPPCLASWRNAGYNTTDVAQYLNVTRQIADSGNVAMGLRMQNADKYRCVGGMWGGGGCSCLDTLAGAQLPGVPDGACVA